MKKIGKILKKLLEGAYWIIFTLLAILGVIIYNLAKWVLATWGMLSINEILYHLNAPLDGTNQDIVMEGVSYCVPLAALVLLLSIILYVGIKEKRWMARILLLVLTAGSIASGTRSVYIMAKAFDIEGYIERQNSDVDFIESEYVDPRNVTITFPEQKRNLIYIILESMETTYTSTERGGGFPFDSIPELAQIAEENVNFSNSDRLGGAHQTPGSRFTMGAIFTQTTGLPLKNLGESDNMNKSLSEKDGFSSGIYNVTDILEDAGYNQYFMIGSDAVFGGRKAYFESHGEIDIWDYYTAVEKGYIPEDYYRWWGYEDEKLFEYAKEKLTEISSQEEPFNFTMLTVDTHFEDGYVCRLCGDEFGDNQYANVMACSSRQVSAFLEWLKEQPFYDNTTVILTGDHLTMDRDFWFVMEEGYDRGVYNAFLNLPEELDTSKEVTKNREFTTLDMFPTTIAALGATIEGDHLGLGVNLFSGRRTLRELYGTNDLDDYLDSNSDFYESLLGDVK